MANVKFHYLYRDGSNYKKWADIVFSNADELSTETVTTGLREGFLEEGIFIAHQVHVPEVFLALDDELTPDDHCFHEFDSVESTSDVANDPSGRSIREFMAEVAGKPTADGAHSIHKIGWRTAVGRFVRCRFIPP